MKFINLKGQLFGDLLVIRRSNNNRHGHALWVCKCVCGRWCVVSGCNLRTGNSTRCIRCKADLTRRQRTLRPYEALYRVLCRNALHPVALSYEQFIAFADERQCHYCGDTVSWAIADVTTNGSGYNLDRKDNRLGYTAENCVACCKRCNRGKSDQFSYEEWLQIGALIRSWKETPLRIGGVWSASGMTDCHIRKIIVDNKTVTP